MASADRAYLRAPRRSGSRRLGPTWNGSGFGISAYLQDAGTLYLIAETRGEDSPIAPLFACLADEVHHMAALAGSQMVGVGSTPPLRMALYEVTQICPVAVPSWLADSVALHISGPGNATRTRAGVSHCRWWKVRTYVLGIRGRSAVTVLGGRAGDSHCQSNRLPALAGAGVKDRRKTMRRNKTVGFAGVALGVILLAVGGLALWGSTYIHNQVTSQLAAQQVFFPPTAAFAHPKAGTEITPSMIPSVSQYAGQQLLTGQQAEAYANDFIAVHLVEIGGGKTYAQLSALSLANPKNAALAGQVQTVFRGDSLRSMLLNAFGWWKVSQIAYIAALVSFGLGAIALLAGMFSLAFARRTQPGAVITAHPKVAVPA
jgi:hypothetical protein